MNIVLTLFHTLKSIFLDVDKIENFYETKNNNGYYSIVEVNEPEINRRYKVIESPVGISAKIKEQRVK